MGLELPPAAGFTELLKQRGIKLENMPLTIEEAVEEIAVWTGNN